MQIVTSLKSYVSSRGLLATVGMFDGVHLGHRHLLAELTRTAANKNFDSAVITFTSHPLEVLDSSRKPRMITSVAERLRLLEAAGVDYCFLIEFTEKLKEQTAQSFLEKLKEDIGLKGILAGFNNNFGKRGAGDLEESAEKAGVEFFRYFPLFIDSVAVSSSAIRKLLLDCDILKANALLGRDFSLTGTVIRGKQIGRTLGFPTANIAVDCREKIIPGNGVYACRAAVEGIEPMLLPAMVNIGTNPTVGPSGEISIEAHFIGLDKDIDLYGKSVVLFFVDYIRQEIRFPSLEILAEQLKEDSTRCLSILSEQQNNRPI